MGKQTKKQAINQAVEKCPYKDICKQIKYNKEIKILKSVIKDYEDYFGGLRNLIRQENIGTLNIEEIIKMVSGLEEALKKEFRDKDALFGIRCKMNENKLLKYIGEYLKSKGWNSIVIGFKGISRRELKHNYSLIIDFTGTKNDVSSEQDAKCVNPEMEDKK